MKNFKKLLVVCLSVFLAMALLPNDILSFSLVDRSDSQLNVGGKMQVFSQIDHLKDHTRNDTRA
ncbi:MAG: hypothetical protein ACI9BD_000958, partial [Candidatus Marinamargulisbacteria bacterium]